MFGFKTLLHDWHMHIQTFADFGGHDMKGKTVKHIATLNQASLGFVTANTAYRPEDCKKRFFLFVDKNPLFADNFASSARAVILDGRKTRSSFRTFDEGVSGAAAGVIGRYYRHFDNK